MKKIACWLCCLLWLPLSVHASLIGDTVDVRFLTSNGLDVMETVIVGPGPDGDFFGALPFDVLPLGFTLSSLREGCGIASCNPTNTVQVEIIDMDLTGPLVSVDVVTPLQNVITTFSTDLLGKSTVSFLFHEQFTPEGLLLAAQFNVPNTSISEPVSAGLLLFGLLGFSLVKRFS